MGIAISWFARQGWTVCVPLTDSQPYDLIVDDDGTLYRVSVKTTTRLTPQNTYEVSLRTKGGNQSRETVKFFDPNESDLLFVACMDGTNYLIPTARVEGRSTITVAGEKYADYQV